jgi:hypothetical protein
MTGITSASALAFRSLPLPTPTAPTDVPTVTPTTSIGMCASDPVITTDIVRASRSSSGSDATSVGTLEPPSRGGSSLRPPGQRLAYTTRVPFSMSAVRSTTSVVLPSVTRENLGQAFAGTPGDGFSVTRTGGLKFDVEREEAIEQRGLAVEVPLLEALLGGIVLPVIEESEPPKRTKHGRLHRMAACVP